MADNGTRYFAEAEECGLEPAVMRFVHGLRDLLVRLQPAAILPSTTRVRSEHGAADLILGHQLLAGLGLVVAVGAESTTVYWARYSTLTRSDDFDDALADPQRVMGRFEGVDFMQPALDRVAHELARPLLLRKVIRRGRLTELQVLLPARDSDAAILIWRHYLSRWRMGLLRAEERLVDSSTSFMQNPDNVNMGRMPVKK